MILGQFEAIRCDAGWKICSNGSTLHYVPRIKLKTLDEAIGAHKYN